MGKLGNIVSVTKVFLNLLGKIFAFWEANFVSATMFPNLPRALHFILHNQNTTDLLQVVNSNKLQQTGQFDKVATSLLKSGLLQLVICRRGKTCCYNLQWLTSFYNQFATSL